MRLAATIFVVLGMVGSAHAEDKPTRAEQAKMLAGMREYAASYTHNLPNFTASQTIERMVQPLPLGPRNKTDLIEEQLSIVDHRETHKVVKLNGKLVSALDAVSVGRFSRGEFGNLLAAIFIVGDGGEFGWNHTATLNGHVMQVFDFKIPAAAGYELQEQDRTIRVAYKGQVWADAQTDIIMRVELACSNIPGKSAYKALDLMVEYKETEVGGKTYILPARSRLHIRTEGELTELNNHYKSYRRFAAESELVFGDEADSADKSKAPSSTAK